MQLNELPAKTGLLWFRQGMAIFRRNPLGLLLTFFVYVLVMTLLSIVPVIGPLLPLLSIPVISVGFMAACRSVVEGKPVLPTVLLSGLRDHGPLAARRLLGLGLAYALAVGAVFAFSTLGDDGSFARLALGSMNEAEARQMGGMPLGAVGLAALAYIPVTMLFWFAPVLCAWHDIGVAKALFFSWVAVWRNRGAFVVYALAWISLALSLSFVVSALMLLLGLQAMALTVLMPISLVVTTLLYCSFYPTYLGCFGVARATA